MPILTRVLLVPFHGIRLTWNGYSTIRSVCAEHFCISIGVSTIGTAYKPAFDSAVGASSLGYVSRLLRSFVPLAFSLLLLFPTNELSVRSSSLQREDLPHSVDSTGSNCLTIRTSLSAVVLRHIDVS
jgi:hypothetical protein